MSASQGSAYSQRFQEGEKFIRRSIATRSRVGGGRSSQRTLLEAQMRMQINLGRLNVLVAEPKRDHPKYRPLPPRASSPRGVSAHAQSPACRSETGHLLAATRVCLVRRRSTASRLRGLPCRLGNNGSWASPPRSRSQTRSTAAVWTVSGVTRSFRPLPRQRTCAPEVEAHVGDSQAERLGNTQTRLRRQGKPCIVTSTESSRAVRGRQ